jgi:tetratricopeptide (TPR) repeat protein
MVGAESLQKSMNPFLAHRLAFERFGTGNLRAAAELFAQALRGFDALLGDPQQRSRALERAGMIPGQKARADVVAEQFFNALPEWLREFHFSGFCEALNNHKAEIASMHWQMLVVAAALPALSPAINLELLRDQACQRFQVTPALLRQSVDDRTDALNRAERILSADGENRAARSLAIRGYADEIQSALEQLAPSRLRGNQAIALDLLTAGKRQRLRVRLRKAVRRLRRHLRRGRGKSEADTEDMIFSYQRLCHYFIGIGEMETALRLARSAQRLRPEDHELRLWARKMRQLRRRR